MDAASATSADQCARALTTSSMMKKVSSGMVATSALSPRLPPTALGSAKNVFTGTPLVRFDVDVVRPIKTPRVRGAYGAAWDVV